MGLMNNEGSTKIVKFMIPGIEGFLLHRSNITHLVKISSRTQTMQTEYAVISKEGAAKFHLSPCLPGQQFLYQGLAIE